jgi:phage gp36-like protein
VGYCTQAHISNYVSAARLVSLADHDGDGTADPAVIAQAIANASGTIDSYLQGLYVVPIPAPYPTEIRRICMVLTVCELQRGLDSVTEDAAAACKEAMEELAKIADGTKNVGLVPLPPASAGAPNVLFEVEDRQFGRSKPL